MSRILRPAFAALAAFYGLSPGDARAGEAACWFEGGQLVAPASVLGVTGDFVIDTGAPRTLLHETRAQAAGWTATKLAGDVRFAGLRWRGRAVDVADLDARNIAMPTPIAGVIGADLLSAYVVDVRFAPCRLALWPAARAPRKAAAVSLPMRGRTGPGMVTAAVSDGTSARRGGFVVATGQDLAVRLADAAASVPSAERPQELYRGGIGAARLTALSFGDAVQTEVLAGLLRPEEEPPGALGAIGAPAMAAHAWRFDFPRRRLSMLKE